MPINITKVEVSQKAGLVQVYAETDTIGYVSVTVEDSNANAIESAKSFYPNTEHIFSFWLTNDTYNFNFSTSEALTSQNMVFFAWGQTNVPLSYFDTVTFANLT